MDKPPHWIKGFLPQPLAVDRFERMRACCGALVGILLTGILATLALGSTEGVPLLIAPMGASAVLLFAVPSSPLAQPWPVLCGNTVAALIGVACAKLIGEPMMAAGFAVALAIGTMFLLRCLHPPSGAIALTAVLGGDAIRDAGFLFAFSPVLLNSALLLAVAILFNNATRRRYPHVAHALPEQRHPHGTADLEPAERLGFTAEDLDEVLRNYNQVLDISRDDLADLFLQAEHHAWRRRFGDMACADIMSRDVVTVAAATPLREAWQILRRHRLHAMPVIGRSGRVVGMVAIEDFLRHAGADDWDDADRRRVLRLPWLPLPLPLPKRLARVADAPETAEVGRIMSAPPQTVHAATHVVDLVPMMSAAGPHHFPVVDDDQRLLGIVSQSDLIAALYRGGLSEAAAVPAGKPGSLRLVR